MGVRGLGVRYQLVQTMLSDVRAVQDGKEYWASSAGQEETSTCQH